MGPGSALTLTGSYWQSPLVLRNSDSLGEGLIVDVAGLSGIRVNHGGRVGLIVEDAHTGVSVDQAHDGFYVLHANKGLNVEWADEDGVYVNAVGPIGGGFMPSADKNGFEVAYAYNNGLYIGHVLDNGVVIRDAGRDGVHVEHASRGVYVKTAGDGVYVESAGWQGVHVDKVGSPSFMVYSLASNGFGVAGAEDNGLYVGRADDNGVLVRSAGDDGIQIGEGSAYPTYGLYIPSPGTPNNALWPNTANAAGEWALYTVDKIRASNVTMDAQTLLAVVGGDQPLSPGDVVTAIGLADPIPGSLNHLAQVRLATADRANVVGVVSSRMALQPAPGKEGEQVMHSTDGPAQPGDYVAITVLGVAQVKVQDGEAIQPGQRLTVSATPGQARALQTRTVEGMVVSEGASVIGAALEAPKDGLVWVLVNPQ